MKKNLFYLLREYCLSKQKCNGCLIGHNDDEENGFRCRTEDIESWSDEEIKKYTKLLLKWGEKNG